MPTNIIQGDKPPKSAHLAMQRSARRQRVAGNEVPLRVEARRWFAHATLAWIGVTIM